MEEQTLIIKLWWSSLETKLVFFDLMRECRRVASGADLPNSLKRCLERYAIEMRKDIVSLTKDGCAPLFIACKNGHIKIVEYLIAVCHADIEQKGRYEMPDDRSIHSVTPLWCAAVSGKLPVVECLVAHGADVNGLSDSGSTPVRSACFLTNTDVVSYLVEHGADIHMPNYNGGTCLINSIQSTELCTFLIEHGADVNAKDVQNKTVLHYAIQEHRLETTKLLLEHNADPFIISRYNDDALQTACLEGTIEIFEYLIENVSYSPERLAEANELMGSTCFESHSDTEKAIHYWRTGLEIRNANAVNGVPIPKRPVVPPREIYRNATEFSTFEELDTIAHDLDAMRIQSLLICERILGPHHKDTLFRLLFRGASYADSFRYQRCIDLWHRALEIRVAKDTILFADTCVSAQALLRIMIGLHNINVHYRNRDKEVHKFRNAVAVFKLLSSQLSSARELLEKRPVHKGQQDSYERILKCVTHLIYLLVETARTNEEITLMNQLVYKLVKEDPRTVHTGDTLLHLCVSKTNTVISTYFNPPNTIYRIFPHYEVVKLLLECGACVNAKNEYLSTPLHLASDPDVFDNLIVRLLLDYDAHLDITNKAGDTPLKLISLIPRNNVNLMSYISLRCYAAQAIIKYGICYTDLPVNLRNFLQLHNT